MKKKMYKKIKDDDRESILGFVKEHQYDYSKPIPVEDVADILNDMQYDFYIEGLTSSCWDWDMTLYLDYYDSNIDAVLCILEMEYQYYIEDEEDFVDLILNLKSIVNSRREKLLFLKDKKDGEIWKQV